VKRFRRGRGFERVGKLPAHGLGLPVGRAKELRLAHAWRRIAGETMARHARARRVLRGILEVEVDERSWYDAVEPLLGSLARELAETCPELGIRRYRLLRADARSLPEPSPLPNVALRRREAPSAPGRAHAEVVPEVPTDPLERLRRLGRRYEARAHDRRPGQKP